MSAARRPAASPIRDTRGDALEPAFTARGRYNAVMDPAALRAYVSRDWRAIAASKRSYWANRYKSEGPRATVDASRALLLEMARWTRLSHT